MTTSSELGAYIASLLTAEGLDTANDLLLVWDASEQTLISEIIDNVLPASPPAGEQAFYGAKVTRSNQVTIPDGGAIVTFDTEVFDIGGYHSLVSNTSRLTVPSGKGGYYLVQGYGRFYSNSYAGSRQLLFYLNGTSILNNAIFSDGTGTELFGISLADIFYIAEGGYVELAYSQNTGHNMDVTSCFFSISYLGPAGE